MADGWLQRDRTRGVRQGIGVKNSGLDWTVAANLKDFDRPYWFKVSTRKLDANNMEVAIQGYWDRGQTHQVMYGKTVVNPKGVDPGDGGAFSVSLGWDYSTAPEDPEGEVGWPDSPSTTVLDITIDWFTGLGGILEVVTYNLAWWFEMLYNFMGGTKTQLDLLSWPLTSEAGYNAPSDVVQVVDDDLDINALTKRMDDSLIIIHSGREVQPERDFSGGAGRRGREYHCTITVLARSAGSLTASDKEHALTYAGYLAEDIQQRLAPVRNPNLLGDWLYWSKLEMESGPYRIPHKSEGTVARVDLTFMGFKMELIGEAVDTPTGNGVLFNFNQPMYEGTAGDLILDHTIINVDDVFHMVGIYGAAGGYDDSGSDYFYHLTSADLRTWTAGSGLQIGSGTPDNWRYIVWAPHIIVNPNYGKSGVAAGCYASYKYLMFFTGVDKTNASADTQKQKIGLAGTNNTDLTGWTILNGDAAIYWCGLETAGYPLGAPWCPAATYDGNYGGASRDPFVFTDGADWYMVMTTKQDGNTARQAVGLAKFSGGEDPDWTDPEHNATAVMEADEDGLFCESATLQKVGSLWHLTTIGQGGTRHQSTATHPASDPFSDDVDAGVLINDSGPDTGVANEVVQLEGDTWIYSGHVDAGTFYWYIMAQADFGTLLADPDGSYPTESTLVGIAGLRGLNQGVLDLDLSWSIGDSEGESGAFYYQPIWGDEATECGYDASGMTGNSYIATHFRHYYPDSGLSGQEWPDYTRTGWIQSANFTVTRNRMELYIAGGTNRDESFIALCRADDNSILFRETGTGDHTLEQRIWDLSSIRGLEVYLVIADLGAGDMDCIDIDAIREYEGTDAATPPDPAGVSVLTLLP